MVPAFEFSNNYNSNMILTNVICQYIRLALFPKWLWIPIYRYPDTWYQEITSNPKFYSLAATFQSRIVGLIVSEVKQLSYVNKEVRLYYSSMCYYC